MSKQVNQNNSNQNNNINHSREKSSFLWGLFNSKSKTCESRNSEDENTFHNLDRCQLNVYCFNSNCNQQNCFSNKSDQEVFINRSQILKLISSESNQIHKKIKIIKELNSDLSEYASRNQISYKDVKLIILKTVYVFNLKIATFDNSENIENLEINSNENQILKLNLLELYTKLVEYQFENLEDNLRNILFYIIKVQLNDEKKIKEDDKLNLATLELLNALTNSGKSINFFRSEIDKLMLNWYDYLTTINSSLTCTYFTFLTNLIRYNASAFLKDTICGFIRKTNLFFLNQHLDGNNSEEIGLCLDLFDIIFRYSFLPADVLDLFIKTLCVAVNFEHSKDLSWKILSNLIKTDLSYSVLQSLKNNILKEEDITNKYLITRGSIYFITNSLWEEDTKVDKLKHQPSYVLPILYFSLEKENLEIAVQVANAIKILLKFQINKFNQEKINDEEKSEINFYNYCCLNSSIFYWSSIWKILFKLTEFCEKLLKESNFKKVDYELKFQNNHKLILELDSISDYIEELFTTNKRFYYDNKTFHFLGTYCSLKMKMYDFENEYPENLIKRIEVVINNYETLINPNNEEWLSDLIKMMDQFFKVSIDANLKIRILKILQNRIKINTEKDEEIIVDKVLITFFKDVDSELDFIVKDQILKFFLDFLKETSNNLLFLKILDVVGKVLNKSISRSRNNSETSNNSVSEEDSNVLIVKKLISIFEEKVYEKSCYLAIDIFKLLVNYNSSHYCEGPNLEKISSSMRLRIFNFMLSIRTNHEGYIGISKDEKPIEFSKYLICKKYNKMPKSPSVNQTTGSLIFNQNLSSTLTISFSFEEMFSYLNLCLNKERDWNFLKIILEKLPLILSNQFIIYSTIYEQVIKTICQSSFFLIKQLQSNNYINLPKGVKSAELQSYIFPIFISLFPYRNYIILNDQKLIVLYNLKGLNSKECINQCMMALTICVSELQDALAKHLAQILSTLSKISPSSQLAIPKLNFLSILNLWPNLYSSFVTEQFLLIFSIILPYTNSTKFDEITVAVAYRVATMWFLSCRYSYRKTVADYAIRYLPENINIKQSKDIVFADEYRKRSSSLNTENDIIKKTYETTSSKASDFSNQSSSSSSNNGNSHNSPSLTSPALVQKNLNMFTFNVNQEKNNSLSPNLKQNQLNEVTSTEYIENFIDLMSRYVVCRCSTLPNTDLVSKFLLENGISETWVFKNKLITITTSSCNSRGVKGDLCEKCFNKLNFHDNKSTNSIKNQNDDDVFNENSMISEIPRTIENNLNKDFIFSRRRHQSAYVPNASASTTSNRKLTSRDDSQIENNLYFYNACSSWASGWAEILIRTPTGNTSWTIKLQNTLNSNISSQNITDFLSNQHVLLNNLNPIKQKKLTNLNEIPQNLFTISNSNKLSQISEQPNQISNLSNQSSLRGRSNTISSLSSEHKRTELRLNSSLLRNDENDLKLGNKLQPSFVFLQYFYEGTFGNTNEAPLLLPKTEIFENTISVFDRITPYETYKIGVVYVDKNQFNDRTAIFRNEYGSERYLKFIKRIGTLIRLDEVDTEKTYIGGLSVDGQDGKYTCIFNEHLTQVVFHIATFMPNKQSDPNCNDKVRHIGNLHVCIVYNDSLKKFDFSTIKGEWLKVCIVITPVENEKNLVHIQSVPELKNYVFYTSPVIISDHNMPALVRQLSINASLLALINQSKNQNFSTSPFLSNWVYRSRQIKIIRKKIIDFNTMNSFMNSKKQLNNSNTNSSNEDISSNSNITNIFPVNFTNYI